MARFAIDPARSRVWIDARSSLHPIHAECAGLEGWLEATLAGDGRIDPAAGARLRIELPVGRLSSGNPFNDRELRRRIDARRHPRITGDATEMKETDRDGRYLVAGDVTFRGETRHYRDEMAVTVSGESITLEGSHTFDIRDFGMEPPRILTLRVHPDVGVRVSIVAKITERS